MSNNIEDVTKEAILEYLNMYVDDIRAFRRDTCTASEQYEKRISELNQDYYVVKREFYETHRGLLWRLVKDVEQLKKEIEVIKQSTSLSSPPTA